LETAWVGDSKPDIVDKPAFHSLEEQALLTLLRTADRLERAVEHKIRPWGVTATQYNVLRILRGAHPRGLTCSAIGDRMITAEPDITRLLSRLKALKLVRQQRSREDRREVWTQISQAGLKLLAEMDAMIERAPVEVIGGLSAAELNELIRLLERAGDEKQTTCDGQRVTREGQRVTREGQLPTTQ
jgi:DNA-binding MarR family transcriptional regulator